MAMDADTDRIQPPDPEPAAIAPDPARKAGGRLPLTLVAAGLAIGLLFLALLAIRGGG